MEKIKVNSILKVFMIFIVSVVIGFLVQDQLQQKRAVSLYPGLRFLEKNENVEAYVSEQATKCDDLPKNDRKRYDCLRSVSKLLTDQVTFKTVVGVLGASSNDCHDLMHNIVATEYKKGASLPEIWQHCSTACFGACYHGGLEGLLSQGELASKNEKDINKYLIEVCNSIRESFGSLNFQCYHGIGHAFMLIYEGDLAKSLKGCDTLKKNQVHEHCYGGVFMENLPNSTTDHIAKPFIKENDPLFPCNAVERQYQATCYAFQTSYFFYLTKSDLPKVIELCRQVPADFRKSCFKQIGLMNINHKSSDQSRAHNICNSMADNGAKASCIEGVIMGFSDRFPNNFQEMKAKGIFEFCERVQVSHRLTCFAKIGETLDGFMQNPEERERACQDIKDSEYKILCQRNGLRNRVI